MSIDRLAYLSERVRVKGEDLEGEARSLAALLRHRHDTPETQMKLLVALSEARILMHEASRLIETLKGFLR